LNKLNFSTFLTKVMSLNLIISSWRKMIPYFLNFLIKYGIFIFFAIFCIVTGFLEPRFLELKNIVDILEETSLVAIVSFGMGIVIAGGGVDLSVGHVAGFAAIITSILLSWRQINTALSILTGVGIGLGVGVLNGVMVSQLGINSFIATLGTMFILLGLRYWVTGGATIMMLPYNFTYLGTGSVFSVPIPIIFMVFTFLILYLFMEFTRTGRYIYMIGENIEANRLAGINIRKYTALVFICSGLLSVLSGILLAARQGLANVDLGDRFLLEAFTVGVLGAAIFGGRNIITGVFLGAILLTSFINGLTVIGVSPAWIYFTKGGFLLGAILVLRGRRRVEGG